MIIHKFKNYVNSKQSTIFDQKANADIKVFLQITSILSFLPIGNIKTFQDLMIGTVS